MKTRPFFFAIILGFVCNTSYAQNVLSDFLMFESNYSELSHYQKTMKETQNVFFNTSQEPMFNFVLSQLKDKEINNLHLYLDCQPGELSFGGLKITNLNIMDYSKNFVGWKQLIKGRVIIHSNDVFDGANGIELKQKLEEITGLPFEIRTN
jgi:hypothetical protein